jgi:small subunit ribosomal protein S20
MATTVSSKKRIRQNKTHNLRNKARKSAARSQTKKVLAAVEKGDKDAARKELDKAYRLIDKCGKHGTVHPNKAANMKSGLARKVKSMK